MPSIPACVVCGSSDTYMFNEPASGNIAECADCQTTFDIDDPCQLLVCLADGVEPRAGWVPIEYALTEGWAAARACLAMRPKDSRRMGTRIEVGFCRLPRDHIEDHRGYAYPISQDDDDDGNVSMHSWPREPKGKVDD